MSIGDPQSFNRYSYVQGQPTNFIDPSGLNVESGSTCYQIVTHGHWSNDPSSSVVSTRIICFGSGGSGGGTFDPGGGGGSGGGGHNSGDVQYISANYSRGEDPNGLFCRRLLGKIWRLSKVLGNKISNLLLNEGIDGVPLPRFPPYLGAPAWTNQLDHGKIIDGMMNNLEGLRQKYRDKCGGDPPPSGPAHIPSPAPARKLMPFGLPVIIS